MAPRMRSIPLGNSNGYTKLICQVIGVHFMIPNTG